MNVIHITIQTSTLIHIVTLGLASFVLSMLLTPICTTYAYKHEWWKKLRGEGMGGVATPVYKKLHAAKHKRNIPTMAGIVFVVSAAIATLVANLSRGETWLPLAGMVTAGAIGLIDDYMN